MDGDNTAFWEVEATIRSELDLTIKVMKITNADRGDARGRHGWQQDAEKIHRLSEWFSG